MPVPGPLGRIERSAKVFISYSRDNLDVARRVYKHLAAFRSNGGSVFFDVEWIQAGDKWKRKLDDGLADADLYLLLISDDFLNSDYCIKEECRIALQRHLDFGAQLWPVIIEDCSWQKFRLRDGRGYETDLGDTQLAGPTDDARRPKAFLAFREEERDTQLRLLADLVFEALLGRPPGADAAVGGAGEPAPVPRPAGADAESPELLLSLCDRSEQITGMSECFRQMARHAPGAALLVAGGCEHDELPYLRMRLVHRAAIQFGEATALAPVRVIEGKRWSEVTSPGNAERVREQVARMCAQSERAATLSIAEAMEQLASDTAHRILVFTVTVEPDYVAEQASRLATLRAALGSFGTLRGHLVVIVLFTLCAPPKGVMGRIADMFGKRRDPVALYRQLLGETPTGACPTEDLGLTGKLRKIHLDEWRSDYDAQLQRAFGPAFEPLTEKAMRDIEQEHGIYYRQFVACYKHGG